MDEITATAASGLECPACANLLSVEIVRTRLLRTPAGLPDRLETVDVLVCRECGWRENE